MLEFLAPIAGSVVGGLLGGSGGGGSQTASKEPWAEAAPWLKALLQQGQDLSSYYTDNPFNPAQTQAYGNMANQSAYMRGLVPSLLGQVSAQPLSYDPGNPMARPQAYQFGGGAAAPGLLGGGQPGGVNLGLLGGGGLNPVSAMPAKMPKATVAAPAVDPGQWSPIPGMTGFTQMPGAYDIWNRDYTGSGA